MSSPPSRRRFFHLFAWPVLGATQAVADTGEDTALTFVRRFGLSNNLRVLAAAAAMRTQTFAMAVARLGPEQARAALQEALSVSIAKHQAAWEHNLALSYLSVLSQAELRSLLEQERASPHVSKLQASQNAIGREMEQRSQALLVTVVSEAIQQVFRAIPESR